MPRVPNDDKGTLVVQISCNGANFRQYWRVVFTGPESEWFWIQNRQSGRCLVVQGAANRNPAQQQTCSDRCADQFWKVYSSGSRGVMPQSAQVKQTTCVPRYDDQWWE